MIYVLISAGFFVGGFACLRQREYLPVALFWAAGLAMLGVWWFIIRHATIVAADDNHVLVGGEPVPYDRIVSTQRIRWIKDPVYRLRFLDTKGDNRQAIFIAHYLRRSEIEQFVQERMKLIV